MSSSLHRLKLDHDQGITNQVGKQLRKFKKLLCIDLFQTSADDQTIKDISSMPLIFLDVRKCPQVSEEAVIDFKKSHPTCQIPLNN